MHFSNLISIVYGALFVLSSCQQPTSELHIACAANVRPALEEIASLYTDDKIQFTSASSGVLSAQIRQGIDYDIFFAANTAYPDSLIDAGLARSPGQIYARGQLILYGVGVDTHLNFRQNIIKCKTLAIANPAYAPYGTAALEALVNEMVYETAREKWVLGSSIAQTNQFIASQSADMGITANSTRFLPLNSRSFKHIVIDTSQYDLINQKAVILSNSKRPKRARNFVHFVMSDVGQTILKKYGYLSY